MNPKRIIVIGTSGSGKTTLAREIARRIGGHHIELDALNWEANWTEAEPVVVRQRVAKAIAHEKWALDGNYSRYREPAWQSADTVIWLNYALPVMLYRIVTRTIRRTIFREKLWAGNVEDPRKLFTKDNMIYYQITTYKRRRRDYPLRLANPEYAHLQKLIFTSPKETQKWLDTTFPSP